MGCLLCGSERFRDVVAKQVLGRTFTVRACTACGLQSVDPLPDEEELLRYYHQAYYGSAGGDAGGPSPSQNPIPGTVCVSTKVLRPERRWWKHLGHRLRAWRLLRHLRADGSLRVLEVGCGQGAFLRALSSQKGVEALGLDLSEASLLRARQAGLSVMRSTLRDARFPDGSFDAVVAIQVIEHVRNPRDEVREMHRVLRPGGIVVLHTPCVTHWKARRSGGAWKYYNPPKHLWHFSPDTLGRLLCEEGFVVEQCSVALHKANLKVLARKRSG